MNDLQVANSPPLSFSHEEQDAISDSKGTTPNPDHGALNLSEMQSLIGIDNSPVVFGDGGSGSQPLNQSNNNSRRRIGVPRKSGESSHTRQPLAEVPKNQMMYSFQHGAQPKRKVVVELQDEDAFSDKSNQQHDGAKNQSVTTLRKEELSETSNAASMAQQLTLRCQKTLGPNKKAQNHLQINQFQPEEAKQRQRRQTLNTPLTGFLNLKDVNAFNELNNSNLRLSNDIEVIGMDSDSSSHSDSSSSSYMSMEESEMKEAQSEFEHIIEEEHSEYTPERGVKEAHLKKYLQKKEKFICGKNFVLATSNPHYQVWKIFQILMNFSSTFQYAYMAAFRSTFDEDALDRYGTIDTIYVIVFTLDIMLQPFIEYHYPSSNQVQRDMRVLAQIYWKNDFLFDFCTMLPLAGLLQWLLSDGLRLKQNLVRLSYLIKCLRLKKAFSLLNYKVLQGQLKEFQSQRLDRIINQSRKQAHSQTEDNTKLQVIMIIAKILRTISLIAVILCISYFSGILWYIYSEMNLSSTAEGEENFISYFGLASRSNIGTVAALTYYIFTSLSTVGFGDYHPRANGERLLGAFMMLFGVMITSLVMDNISGMISQIKTFNDKHDETERLHLFFGTLKRFNKNIALPSRLQDRIEDYFNYRWANHRNLAVSTDDDFQLFDVLPDRVQRQIYTEFLFSKFLESYIGLFKATNIVQKMKTLTRKAQAQIPIKFNPQARSREDPLQWKDDRYQDLVIDILKQLEPKIISSKVIQKQNTVVEEVVFFMDGSEFEVGYNHEYLLIKAGVTNLKNSVAHFKASLLSRSKSSQNMAKRILTQKLHFPLHLKGGIPIGLFDVCFNMKSQFIYRLKANITKGIIYKPGECFFIRKRNWRKVFESSSHNASLLDQFKNRIILQYVDKIFLPIAKYQEDMIEIEKKKNDPLRGLRNVVMILTKTIKTNTNAETLRDKLRSGLARQANKENEKLFEQSSESSKGSLNEESSSKEVDHPPPPMMTRDNLLQILTSDNLSQQQRHSISRLSVLSQKEKTFDEIIKEINSRMTEFESDLAGVMSEKKDVERQLEAQREQALALRAENDMLKAKLRDNKCGLCRRDMRGSLPPPDVNMLGYLQTLKKPFQMGIGGSARNLFEAKTPQKKSKRESSEVNKNSIADPDQFVHQLTSINPQLKVLQEERSLGRMTSRGSEVFAARSVVPQLSNQSKENSKGKLEDDLSSGSASLEIEREIKKIKLGGFEMTESYPENHHIVSKKEQKFNFTPDRAAWKEESLSSESRSRNDQVEEILAEALDKQPRLDLKLVGSDDKRQKEGLSSSFDQDEEELFKLRQIRKRKISRKLSRSIDDFQFNKDRGANTPSAWGDVASPDQSFISQLKLKNQDSSNRSDKRRRSLKHADFSKLNNLNVISESNSSAALDSHQSSIKLGMGAALSGAGVGTGPGTLGMFSTPVGLDQMSNKYGIK